MLRNVHLMGPLHVKSACQWSPSRRYACDRAVISLLHSCTLSNSPTTLRNTLHELHSKEWLCSQLDYLSNFQRHKKRFTSLNIPVPEYQQPALPPPFPKPQWFLVAYIRNVWSRMEDLLAAATLIYGSTLKINSTKKICKKLQGADAESAAQTKNVGNERGEIL